MKIILALIIAPLLLFAAAPCHSYVGIFKQAMRSGGEFIEYLANLGKSRGGKAVMRELETGASHLSGAARTRYIQDGLTKTLVAQKRLSKVEADEWLKNLAAVPGFEKTLTRMTGRESSALEAFELTTANALVKHGYKVKEISKIYKEGAKDAAKYIGMVASKDERDFALQFIEIGAAKLDDKLIETLVNELTTPFSVGYSAGNIIPVLMAKARPANPATAKALDEAVARKGATILYGEPEALAKVFGMLK